MSSTMYIGFNGKWKEIGIASDFEIKNNINESLSKLSGSISGQGELILNISGGFDDLPKSLRKRISPQEKWRGEGKRKMKVIK